VKNDRTSVLLIDGSDFESYPLGGINHFVRTLLKTSRPGRDIDLRLAGITCEKAEPVGQWQRKRIANREWSCYTFGYVAKVMDRKPLMPVRIQTFVFLLQHIRRLLTADIQVIYVHLPELAFLACLFARHRIATVFHLHGVIDRAVTSSRYQGLNNGLVLAAFRFMNRFVIRRAAAVIAVSREGYELCTQIRRCNDGLVYQLPVLVDQSLFKPSAQAAARQELAWPRQKKMLLYVGRLEQVKGLPLLIETLARLVGRSDDWHLILAGDGSEKASLMELAQAKKVLPYMTFAGFVDHDSELVRLYNAADLLLLSSLAEGCPTAVLEAQSCGLPVVAAAVGEVPGIVTHGVDGYLVPDRDPQLFAQMIAAAMDQRERLAANSLEACARFNHEQLGNLICDILLSVGPHGR